MRHVHFIRLTAIGASLCLGSAVQAALITPVSATASSHYDGRSANNTINSSGLSGNMHSSNPDGTAWLSHGDVDSDGQPEISWDLGNVYEITGFHLWNYNVNDTAPLLNEGIKETVILTSLTGEPGSFTALPGTFTFVKATGLDTYEGEDYVIPAVSARFVEFAIVSNFGGLDNFPNIISKSVGVSEIRFEGSVVPEPASGMALLAAGTVGLLRRRRVGA